MFGNDGYGMEHRPTFGPPLSDLLEGDVAPRDIYTTPLQHYTGYPALLYKDDDVAGKIFRAYGKPAARFFIYRAGPTSDLNPGDWVTLSRYYAHMHRAHDPVRYKTCGFRVNAGDVRWAGDDLMEWGYWGPPLKAAWSRCDKAKQYRSTR